MASRLESVKCVPVEEKSSSEEKTLRILTIGQVGSGKSALVNALLKDNVAEEKHSATVVTRVVDKYTRKKSGVKVEIFDTPGLLMPNKSDRETFAEIADKTDRNVDLILFCKNMTTRIDRGDTNLICRLTEAFGESIWKNTLIVLTFANQVELPRKRGRLNQTPAGATVPEALETYFVNKQREMESLFNELMKNEAGVSPEIADAIPVVLAAYYETYLPGCENWLTQLYEKAHERVKGSAQPAFLNAITAITSDISGTPSIFEHGMMCCCRCCKIVFTTIYQCFITAIGFIGRLWQRE